MWNEHLFHIHQLHRNQGHFVKYLLFIFKVLSMHLSKNKCNISKKQTYFATQTTFAMFSYFHQSTFYIFRHSDTCCKCTNLEGNFCTFCILFLIFYWKFSLHPMPNVAHNSPMESQWHCHLAYLRRFCVYPEYISSLLPKLSKLVIVWHCSNKIFINHI